MLAQNANDQRRDGFVELEHDVTDEAVADHYIERAAIARAGGEIPSFQIPMKVEPRLLEEHVRLLYHRVSFFRLLTDREQADRGIGTAEDAFSVNRAKPCELKELLRGAVDVGA